MGESKARRNAISEDNAQHLRERNAECNTDPDTEDKSSQTDKKEHENKEKRKKKRSKEKDEGKKKHKENDGDSIGSQKEDDSTKAKCEEDQADAKDSNRNSAAEDNNNDGDKGKTKEKDKTANNEDGSKTAQDESGNKDCSKEDGAAGKKEKKKFLKKKKNEKAKGTEDRVKNSEESLRSKDKCPSRLWPATRNDFCDIPEEDEEDISSLDEMIRKFCYDDGRGQCCWVGERDNGRDEYEGRGCNKSRCRGSRCCGREGEQSDVSRNRTRRKDEWWEDSVEADPLRESKGAKTPLYKVLVEGGWCENQEKNPGLTKEEKRSPCIMLPDGRCGQWREPPEKRREPCLEREERRGEGRKRDASQTDPRCKADLCRNYRDAGRSGRNSCRDGACARELGRDENLWKPICEKYTKRDGARNGRYEPTDERRRSQVRADHGNGEESNPDEDSMEDGVDVHELMCHLRKDLLALQQELEDMKGCIQQVLDEKNKGPMSKVMEHLHCNRADFSRLWEKINVCQKMREKLSGGCCRNKGLRKDLDYIMCELKVIKRELEKFRRESR